MATRLTMEARLVDFVSKNLDTMEKNIDKFSKNGASNLKKLDDQTKSNSASLKTLFVAAAAFVGVAKLVSFLKESTAAAKEQAIQLANLEATLQSTKHAAGLTIDELTDMAGALQKVTLFGDETTNKAQAMLLTFTKIGKEIFPRATETVLNMAVKFGSAEAAAVQLGKALNDPITGVTALRRVGVALTDQQEAQIKTMVKQNDLIGAQKVILNELETEFGGLARAMANTPSGKITQAANAFGDFKEVIGEFILDMGAALSGPAMKFISMLQTEAVQAFKTLKPLIEGTMQTFSSFNNSVGENNSSLFTFQDIVTGVARTIAAFNLGLRVVFEVVQSLGQTLGWLASYPLFELNRMWENTTLIAGTFGKVVKAVFEKDFASIPAVLAKHKEQVALNNQATNDALATQGTILANEIKENVDDTLQAYEVYERTLKKMKTGDVVKKTKEIAPKAVIDPFSASTDNDKSSEIDFLEAHKANIDKIAKEEEAKLAYLENLTKATTQRKIEAMAEGVEKELELNKFKTEQMKSDLYSDVEFQILTAKQKQDTLSSIEALGASERNQILAEEGKIRAERQKKEFQESVQKYSELSASFLSSALSVGSSFEQMDANRDKKATDRKLKELDKQFKAGTITSEQFEKKKADLDKQAEERNKDRARRAQDMARLEALVNVALGVTKALSTGDVLSAVAVGLFGGAQLAKIEAQEFKEGGLVTGRNRLFSTNEDGRPEYVLKADAVNRIGVSNLDRLNNGGSLGGSVTIVNNNNYAPVNTINSPQKERDSFRSLLENNTEEFFDFFEEKMRKGYKRKVRG